MNGAGQFTLTQATFNGVNGSSALQTSQTSSGTYTIGTNCTLQLTFNSTGNTGNFAVPTAFYGLINQTESNRSSGTAGEFTIQLGTGQTVVGQLYQQ